MPIDISINQSISSLLKIDYFITLLAIYNKSDRVIQIMVKEGDYEGSSEQETLSFDKSGIIQLFPGRSMRIRETRIDDAQIERLNYFLGVYSYFVSAVSVKNTRNARHNISGYFSQFHTVNQSVNSSIRGLYAQTQKLIPSSTNITGSNVGKSVALSNNGSRLFVSAPLQYANRGEVHIYNQVGDGFVQIGSVSGQDTQAGDHFGFVVESSADGEVLVIGSPHFDNDQISQVYIFHKNNDDSYSQVQQIFDPSEAQNTQFGYRLQLSGDKNLLIVSAPEAESGNGIVYVYRFLFGSYYLDQILTSIYGGQFGHYVDIQGTTLVISAPLEVVEGGTGAVYAYEYDIYQYVLIQKIECDQPGISEFGDYLALVGDKLFVGHPDVVSSKVFYYDRGVDSFIRNPSYDVVVSNSYGQFIAHTRYVEYLFIGSDGQNMAGVVDVYTTEADPDVYTARQTLLPSDTMAGQEFGASIACSANGEFVVVGAPGADSGDGAVYVFKRSWDQIIVPA